MHESVILLYSMSAVSFIDKICKFMVCTVHCRESRVTMMKSSNNYEEPHFRKKKKKNQQHYIFSTSHSPMVAQQATEKFKNLNKRFIYYISRLSFADSLRLS